MELNDLALVTGVVISLCAVVVLAIQAPLQRRTLREVADRSRVDLITALDEIGTMAMRIEAMERGLRRLVRRIDQLQLGQGVVQDNYAEALDLIRAGARTEQLVRQCGLSQGEAELLRRLHADAA